MSIFLGIIIFSFPDSFAQPNLFVSAENPQFDNSMAGPQVIEVVVIDSDINNPDELENEPDVMVNGKILRMVQAVDGNWYGYFADKTMAMVADGIIAIDGNTGEGLDFGGICDVEDAGIAVAGYPSFFDDADAVTISDPNCGAAFNAGNINVLREAKAVNDNIEPIGQIGIVSVDAWPFIQLYNLNSTNKVNIQYNKGEEIQEVTLNFHLVDQYSNLELDRFVYPPNSEVHLTLTDLQLNIDPTDEDYWTFMTNTSGGLFYQLFNQEGKPNLEESPDPIDLSPHLSDLMFDDNGRLFLDPLGNGSIPYVVNLKNNDIQNLSISGNITEAKSFQGSLEAGSQPITFKEIGKNSGIFGNFDDNGKSNLVISSNAQRGTFASIEYKKESQPILVSSSFIQMNWEQFQYFVNDVATLNIWNNDMNYNSKEIDRFVVMVSSLAFPQGKELEMKETSFNSGIFKGNIKFVDLKTSQSNELEVLPDGDTVVVDHLGIKSKITVKKLGLVSNGESSPKIIDRGELDEIQGNEIPIENYNPGIIQLTDVEEYFPVNNVLREKINEINLRIGPIYDDGFIEYDDKFVLMKTTKITITSNEEFISIFGNNTQTFPETIEIIKDGKIITISGDDYIDEQINDLRTKCKTLVSKEYCGLSNEELKNDIVNKFGVHTIQEKFEIDKNHLDKYTPSEFPKLISFENNNLLGEENLYGDYHFTSGIPNFDLNGILFPSADAQQLGAIINGSPRSSHLFLNGFTLGHGYSWGLERDWDYKEIKVFEGEVTASVGLGIGLRIPIEIRVNDANTITQGDFEYSVDLYDARKTQYRNWLSEDKLFEGQEFVLQIGPDITANVDFLGNPLKDVSVFEEITGFRPNMGNSFEPPLGGAQEEFVDQAIPCFTNPLCQEVVGVTVTLEPGVKGKIEGKELAFNLTHMESGKSKKIHFSNPTSQKIKHSFDSSQNLENYDIKLDQVTYGSKIIVVPFLRGSIDLGMFSFLPVIGQGYDNTIELYQIEFDDIKIKNHEGTMDNNVLTIQDYRIKPKPPKIPEPFPEPPIKEEWNSLIIDVTSSEGEITIEPLKKDCNANTFVLVDGEEVEYIKQNEMFTVEFPNGTKKIEFYGACVIPEFGIMTGMIFIIAITSIITLSIRNKIFARL